MHGLRQYPLPRKVRDFWYQLNDKLSADLSRIMRKNKLKSSDVGFIKVKTKTIYLIIANFKFLIKFYIIAVNPKDGTFAKVLG